MSLGFGQIIIIVIVILLIFGASRLPRIAEDLAKGMKAFKKGLADDENAPDGDVPAPSHPVRAKPARTLSPAKGVAKPSSNAKKTATKALASKTVTSKGSTSKSSAAIKSTKTAGAKKAPDKKSGKHV